MEGKINFGFGSNIYRDLSASEFLEHAILRKEGILTENGAFATYTGKYTGRSPEDRYIVDNGELTEKICWGKTNRPLGEKYFDAIYVKMQNYLKNKDLFVFNGYAGTMKEYRLPISVVCEKAYQALFAHQLFVRPTREEINTIVPEFTVISAPGFKASGKEDGINSEVFIIINFKKKLVLIGGDSYCGEIKKSIFSVMNFLMPTNGILPMHCSANIGNEGDTAVFFGLSGTGKTTLSADPERKLIGDDEHGWSKNGIFNFEGGCYAKAINLDPTKEVEIYNAIKFGTVLENVVLDKDRKPIYNDNRFTENTRAAYPVEYIQNVELKGIGGIPKAIIFLTADAFGVIPPISILTKEAAMYHFMSGYTSKVAGTERGITKPQATFSTCFGAPFMPLHPSVYAEMLGKKIEKYNTEVFLINTGWLNGGYGKGDRIKLSYTRAMITAILQGKLKNVKKKLHPIFNVYIPESCAGVPTEILDPENTWEDKTQYMNAATELANMFKQNFEKFENVSDDIIKAGPIIKNY